MGLVDRLAARLGYVKQRPSQPARLARHFKAGEYSRLTHSWTLRDASINSELYQGLRVMRSRSRELFANNEFAANFIRSCKTNIAGPSGFTFRSQGRNRATGQLDRDDNRRIERRFADFSKRGHFDVSGRFSRAQAEQMLVETMARDGEYLALIRGGYDNPHRFALQFIDIDRLDIEKNSARDSRTGLRTIMGVDVDDDWRPHYYWILRRHPNGETPTTEVATGDRHDRIPASRVIHDFVAVRPEQVRGFPWMHAGMIGLWDIGGYREAAIINARVGANKLGFIIGGEPDDDSGAGVVTDISDVGEQISDSEPGEWNHLPEDVDVKSWDPTYPHEMFAEFNSAMLHGVAAAFGVAHHSLTGDLSGVNFATGKIGLLAERDLWMTLQSQFSSGFHDGFYSDWLRAQLAADLIPPIPAGAFDAKNAPAWKGRRWPSVEPLKEAQANAIKVGMRQISPRRLMEMEGLDPDEEWQTMAEDNETLAALGLPLTLPSSIQIHDAEAPDA